MDKTPAYSCNQASLHILLRFQPQKVTIVSRTRLSVHGTLQDKCTYSALLPVQ